MPGPNPSIQTLLPPAGTHAVGDSVCVTVTVAVTGAVTVTVKETLTVKVAARQEVVVGVVDIGIVDGVVDGELVAGGSVPRLGVG